MPQTLTWAFKERSISKYLNLYYFFQFKYFSSIWLCAWQVKGTFCHHWNLSERISMAQSPADGSTFELCRYTGGEPTRWEREPFVTANTAKWLQRTHLPPHRTAVDCGERGVYLHLLATSCHPLIWVPGCLFYLNKAHVRSRTVGLLRNLCFISAFVCTPFVQVVCLPRNQPLGN